MNTFHISAEWLTLTQFEAILESGMPVGLSEESKQSIAHCRSYLDQKLASNEQLIYGINTGFGSLCNTRISVEELEQLQLNLVLSHACGTGEEVPSSIVRRMLLLKAIGLSKGASGAQLETVERLLYFYNEDIIPVVYQLGSLGASGDLAPLAHLSLPLIGYGEVYEKGIKRQAAEVLQERGLQAIRLKSKEGLALLNGTQFMSAYATFSAAKSMDLWEKSCAIAALSLDAFDGRTEPFAVNVNQIRNQKGQIRTAERMRELLRGSKIAEGTKKHVQDPYSFRCIPQVHGASLDAISYANEIIEREINAVTDNPTIFPDEDQVISAGNFHGQPLALTMDFLCIALAELGSISERRIYKLISGTRDLPPFLVAKSGLNSGFMIPQYTAASIASQNRQLCTPASVDSIDSSNGQEDHVSMGANAATKLYRVIENVYSIYGIELLTAAQAIDFRSKKSAEPIEQLRSAFREKVNFVENDTFLHPLIQESIRFVKEYNLS